MNFCCGDSHGVAFAPGLCVTVFDVSRGPLPDGSVRAARDVRRLRGGGAPTTSASRHALAFTPSLRPKGGISV